ncbi:phytanoyl-CoA dioxygenase family protein [Alteriqipengyuania lutimaris]|nr:phytanoyl-CoA dioxygenase family protein [Alteriqipengyuania lutimaris]MBB3033828.1 ectoine hydroxylase-related dioxygenase (phytanoyl-CoA dioxygenase family) [Alteriqipengyuania lutimaris]
MNAASDLAPRSQAASVRGAIERDGFVVLRSAIDPRWIAAHRPALRDYVMARIEAMDDGARATGASTTSPTFKLTDAPEEVRAFVTGERIGAMAADLLGVDAVRLLHFCGFFKPAGGAPTPWHRDDAFLPVDTPQVVTAWIPLLPVDATMGMLGFAAPETRDGAGPPARAVTTGAMEPGDISFHLARTLHCGGANTSDAMREAIAICFYADGARISADDGAPFRAAMRAHYFAELEPGDRARSDANPVVFPAPPRVSGVPQ